MLIIDKIKKYFDQAEWDYKFIWNDGKRYGDKYSTIKVLSQAIGHPKTSLYLSIHQLTKEGFITFSGGLIAYERVLNSEQDVQECDATDDASSTEAGEQNNLNQKQQVINEHHLNTMPDEI